MADAARGSGVDSGDPEATIDAVEPRADDIDVSPVAPEASRPARDFAELAAVDRSNYAIGGELAKGGVGRVIEARDLRLGRDVAIKELLPKNRDAARRFEREARVTARLQHPGIIHVYEAGVWPGGEPFYAMPKVPGRSLDKAVAERKTLVERLALVPHVIAVADALAYAHNEKVIHRDLKPANVLVGEFGETVVIDWGLAKELGSEGDPRESMQLKLSSPPTETMAGGIVGTPAYMPPEQARGLPVDQRADVYAIGALLYKVLAGVAPYIGPTSKDVIEMVKAGPPVPLHEREPGTPPDLAAIVAKAMARELDDRYSSAGELAKDLGRFQTGQLVAAHRYTRRQLMSRFVRRHRVALVIAVAAAATLAIGATLSVRRILAEKARTDAKRFALLEERGRTELLAERAGPSLAYLVNAAHDHKTTRARGFLLGEAMRAFDAEIAPLSAGSGDVVIASSADGEHLATAGDDVRLWSIAGTDEGMLLVHGRVRALAFDPAGTRLVAGGDDAVAWIWQLAPKAHGGLAWLWPRTTAPPVVLHGHTGKITDIQFSPDGMRVVTASTDGTARVWDMTGRLLGTSNCEQGPLVSARFAHTHEWVVIAGEDGACVWAYGNGTTVPLHGHTGPVRSARWSPDDARVVTAGDDGTARVFDSALGKPLVEKLKHDNPVITAEFSPDGETILTASDRTAFLWELPDDTDGATRPQAHVFARLAGHTDTIRAATFGASGELVATAGIDRVARVWNATTGEAVAEFEHADVVSALDFAGGTRLVTADGGGRAHVWDVTRTIAHRPHELHDPVHAIAIAGNTLAAGREDSRVTLILGDAAEVDLRDHIASVDAVAFSSDGALLVTLGGDPKPIVWDVATRKQHCQLGEHDPTNHGLAVWGHVAAVGSTGGVELWSLDDCTHVATLPDIGARLAPVAFHSLVVAAADDGSVVFWDPAARTQSSFHPLKVAVTALSFSPDGRFLVVAGDGDARIYAVEALRHGDRRGERSLDGPFGKVRAVVWLDNARVVTANTDGVATIWDADKGKLLGVRGAHESPITSLAYAGDTLWMGRQDGVVRAWDVGVSDLSSEELDRFLAAHNYYELGDDDVVRRTGADDGKR